MRIGVFYELDLDELAYAGLTLEIEGTCGNSHFFEKQMSGELPVIYELPWRIRSCGGREEQENKTYMRWKFA